MPHRHPNHRPVSSLPAGLRRTTVPDPVRSWIHHELGSEVVRVRRLEGASSAAVHRLWLADGGSIVLRRYVWPWPDEPPATVASREVDVLRFTAQHDLPVPMVLATDVDGSSVGDGIPSIVMTLLPGTPLAMPDLRALAELAASIHDVDATDLPHAYGPWYQDAMTSPPPTAQDPGLCERALALWREGLPPHGSGLVHRDFHPGNVLTSRRRMSVVDWANGCAGPWGCDIAHCRDNLVGLSGWAAADEFLAAYTALTGRVHDPFWEIASALEHSPGSMSPERVTWSEVRLRRALDALGR